MITEATRAAALPLTALSLLRREPRLLRLAIGPVLISILLVGLAVSVVLTFGSDWIASLQQLVPEWIYGDVSPVYHWLWIGPLRALVWLALKMLWVAMFATAALAAVLLSGAVAAPLLDLLSAAVEDHVRGVVPEADGGIWAILRSGGRAILEALLRLLVLFGVWAVLAILGLLIPVLGWLTPLLLAAVTACFATLDHSAYALDRRELGLSEKRRWLGEHRAGVVGFGASALCLSAIPLLNLLAAPVLAIAGTLFVLAREPQVGGTRGDGTSSEQA